MDEASSSFTWEGHFREALCIGTSIIRAGMDPTIIQNIHRDNNTYLIHGDSRAPNGWCSESPNRKLQLHKLQLRFRFAAAVGTVYIRRRTYCSPRVVNSEPLHSS